MLKNFKKNRTNKSAAATMKKNAATYRAKNPKNKEETESDSDYSDSSDSEYEEILISNINKTKIKEDVIEAKDKPKKACRGRNRRACLAQRGGALNPITGYLLITSPIAAGILAGEYKLAKSLYNKVVKRNSSNEDL